MGTDGNMLPSRYGTLDAEIAIETLHEHINTYDLNLLAKPYATVSDIYTIIYSFLLQVLEILTEKVRFVGAVML